MSILVTGCVNRGHGLHNFGVVATTTNAVGFVSPVILRGGQPDSLGIQTLRALQVKTVLDLTGDGETRQDESAACREAGIAYHHVPLNGLLRPSNKQLTECLLVINNGGPVYVHCVYGSDRTSAVIAFWRKFMNPKVSTQDLLNEALDYGLLVPDIATFIKGL